MKIISNTLLYLKKDLINKIYCNQLDSKGLLWEWNLQRLEDLYYQTVLLLYLAYKDKLPEKNKN